MKIDKFGQQIYTEEDLCEIYYKNPNVILNKVIVEVDIPFADILELQNLPKFTKYEFLECSVEEFDLANQQKWLMPSFYKDMDIATFVLNQCTNDAELQRAGEELILFQERDMFDLLRYLKYLVDIMREHNIVYGVGRGSSVASFVLFLLGVHRINSLYYDLSIDEFIK